MANRYPPTPSFGGAFPSLPYPSLPVQQNGHHLFAGRPPVTSPMGMPQPTSAGNPQSMNASHFAVNAQIPSAGAVMPPVPHLFPQELFKQLANSSLPPPPPPSFPPVPIPNLGFSTYQPPPSLSNNFTTTHNHNPDNPTGNTSNMFQNQERTQPVFEQLSQPIIGSREEGELSDGELEEHSVADSTQTLSRTQAATMQISLDNGYTILETQGLSGPLNRTPPLPGLNLSPAGQKATNFQQTYPSSQSQSHPQYAANMGNVLQSQGNPISEITPLTRKDSGSSYDPPSVTTPEFALDHANGRDETSPQIHGKSPSQMRELAKGALLSLAPHGIRYPDLVKEGVDPDLLLQLYEEIGIKDSRPELSAGVRTYEAIQTPKQKAVPSIPKADTNTRSTILPDKPFSGLAEIPGAADLKAALQIQQNVTEPNSDLIGPSKDNEKLLLQTQSAPNISTNSPPATAATNVAMERKDRIAQLLAAKTGKPAPIRSTPDATPMPVQVKLPVDTVPQLKAPTTSAESTTTPNMSNQPLPKSVKNKAQTELVRQKMESLKKEAEAKSRAQTQSQAFIPPRPNIPVSDPNTTLIAPAAEQSLSTNVNQQNIAHASDSSRQTSAVISNLQPLTKFSPQPSDVYRIPGLFMTSDESFHAEQQLSITAGGQADKSACLSSDREDDFEQESGTSSTRDPNSVPASLTEFNLTSLGNQSSTSLLPQKRPLASDSFDEPAPAAKRPFGRKDSTEHIEISVSNEGSDDGSDGIGMDIDEDSQVSGLLINSATPRKEASEQDLQLSLPTAKLPERPSVQQQMTNSNLGLSTPSKEKDKEDLWRAKNAEIEAMRKRIAEMEQRRKAKQGQSQAQSPQASLPGTPIPMKVQASSPTRASPSPASALHTYGSSPTQPLGNVYAVVEKATNDDHQFSGPNPLSRLATESPSQNEDLRKKMARRKELQDGLPNLDAEVQATQLKLAQAKARLAAIKREAEKREAEIREARQREAEIAAEATKLEEQLNMGLKGRSRFSEELQSLGADLEVVPEAQTIFTESLEYERTAFNSDQNLPPTNPSPQPGTHDMPVVLPVAENGSVVDVGHKIVTAGALIHKDDSGAAEDEDAAVADSSSEQLAYEAESSAPAATSVLNWESYKELDDKTRLQSRIPADHDSYQSSIIPRSSEEESVGADNVAEARSANLNGIAAGLDYDNDGSVSMSDSGTDDYEPAEVPDTTQYSDMESEGYEPDDGLLQGIPNQGDASDIDEEYEPAEEVEPMEVDLRNIQPISVNNYQHPRSRQAGHMDERASDPCPPELVDKPATDGVEDGLELYETNTLTKPQDFPQQANTGVETDDASNGNQAKATHFTAYQSPLFFSKNFRFDPNFTALVAGGYNSLTYSNKIDPSRPLCPTEAEGGTCADPKCKEQHFRQVALPDDKILVEMSSARDFKQEDQRDQFLVGLKQVIAELRSKGVKEFPTVASALAAYRRTFAESIDPNRAIPL